MNARFAFRAISIRHHGKEGETLTVHRVAHGTPEEQRELFNRAVIGYDPHHALATDGDMRFLSPVDIAKALDAKK